jgi:hypothetical protein
VPLQSGVYSTKTLPPWPTYGQRCPRLTPRASSLSSTRTPVSSVCSKASASVRCLSSATTGGSKSLAPATQSPSVEAGSLPPWRLSKMACWRCRGSPSRYLPTSSCASSPGPGSAPGSGVSPAGAAATPSLQRWHVSFGRFSTRTKKRAGSNSSRWLTSSPMGVRCWPHPGHRHSSASGCTSTSRLSRCAGRAWAPRTGGRLGVFLGASAGGAAGAAACAPSAVAGTASGSADCCWVSNESSSWS